MSHDRSRRAACGKRNLGLEFHSEMGAEARGVTAVVVGSGGLLGRKRRGRKWLGLRSIAAVN